MERAESREKRISASGWIEPSVPMQSAVSQAPRRMASTPSWMAEAPEAQAVERVMGEPWGPNSAISRAAMPPLMVARWISSEPSVAMSRISG